MTRIVASAVSSGASAVSCGVSARRPNTTGSTVAGTSMFTVPTMVGVRSRRNRASRIEITMGMSDEATTRVARSVGPPSVEGTDADPDKGPGGAHEEQVSRSDPAQPNRLQRRTDATDGDRAEHGPGQVRVGSAAGPDDDCGDKDDAGDAQNHQLQAASES